MLLRTKDLAERWQVDPKTVTLISPSILPRVNISLGKKRPTYRFKLKDIERFERTGTVQVNK